MELHLVDHQPNGCQRRRVLQFEQCHLHHLVQHDYVAYRKGGLGH